MLKNKAIKSAIEKLKKNKIVILPSDTIYGLSALFNLENEKRINVVKQAPLDKKNIVLFSSIKQAQQYGLYLTDEIINILKSTNPTTVILLDQKETIAIRIVKRKDIAKIIKKVGPIFSSSVNLHSQHQIGDQKKLSEFVFDIELFWDGELNSQPSKIYNSLTKEWIR
ncbi:tRNA threonylcarbamoyladenosine biosynthesis protein [Williamsoniiplasma somnilux]|uniref:L-threonylcarbamoyladenylate synthase n=1 Tax=Williamsoniiplasma somnilux TaxID=215578 RepID=A0A2K8NXE3_9MOLU|nr:Sua5/YciO/YrdC/YwlC family protein [Williamsoniiplasma somnilux]ATZ18489.1 tRNA threonylcarbamoyladenosine biosynthesis protein [Williamsoniiplasma somnilux]